MADTTIKLEHTLRQKLTRFLSERATLKLPEQVRGPRLEALGLLRRVEAAGFSSFLFGGLLRDLMTASPLAQPRDIDIVIDCLRREEIEDLARDFAIRANRFGGIRVMSRIPIDLWCLRDTWAFTQGLWPRAPENLPKTTFLNVEAVVASITPRDGKVGRRIYSAGFFEAIDSQTLRLNCPDNPYPALCIVRTIVMARRLDFWLEPGLGEYLVREVSGVSEEDLEQAQRSHYGAIRYGSREVRRLISDVAEQLESGYDRIILPGSRKSQKNMWQTSNDHEGSLHL
jgi:hypothetical protein